MVRRGNRPMVKQGPRDMVVWVMSCWGYGDGAPIAVYWRWKYIFVKSTNLMGVGMESRSVRLRSGTGSFWYREFGIGNGD